VTGGAAARFGFLVHPLDPGQRRLLGVRTADAGLIAGRSQLFPGPCEIATLSLRTARKTPLTGWLMALPDLPAQLIDEQERAVRDLAVAVRACADRGATVVGLGALTALVGAHGRALAEIAAVPVTSGTALTSWAAVETLALARRHGVALGPLALFGLPGPAAMGIARLLAHRGLDFEAVLPTPNRVTERELERLAVAGSTRIRVRNDVEGALAEGRVIVAASSTGGRLPLSRVPRGAVIVDVAEPVDVLYDVPRREDVLVLDGELVSLPSPLTGTQPWTWVYGAVTGQRDALFACFVEPMVIAAAQAPELAGVGRDVPLERVVALGAAATAQGFTVRRLYERGEPLREARLRAFATGRPSIAPR